MKETVFFNKNKRLVAVVFGILLVISFFLWAYIYFNKPLSIEHIEQVNDPGNRLRISFKINTTRSCDAYIEYWQTNSNDTLYSVVSENKAQHTILLTNMEGAKKYKFRVSVKSGSGKVHYSKEYYFNTEPIYHATPYFTLDSMNAAFRPVIKNTYFLTQILTEPGSLIILNSNGEIVWYAPFKKGIKVSHWTPQKTILCIAGEEKIPSSGGDEIIEMDLTGKIITHLQVGIGDMDKLVHHEVRQDKEGNIYALTFDKKIFDLSKVGGTKQDTVNADGIVVFNRQGKKIWEWSIFDHLDPLTNPLILKDKKDWTHANALFKKDNGDFLISFRNLNQVWNIDGKTGEVKWKLGEKGDFNISEENLFSGQHAVHINPNGELMMLDNGIKKKITRALSFHLDEINKRVAAVINVPLDSNYFSPSKGNAFLFDNDKILFCLTEPRAFLITDMKSNILWHITIDGNPYRLEPIYNFLNKKPSW
ncbi:MAG TPA: aryl-sulfate sulfotransferase [Hanamia sp.]